jgi:hypothetical protein
MAHDNAHGASTCLWPTEAGSKQEQAKVELHPSVRNAHVVEVDGVTRPRRQYPYSIRDNDNADKQIHSPSYSAERDSHAPAREGFGLFVGVECRERFFYLSWMIDRRV